MQESVFQKQMDRMISNFGKNAYGTEKMALIWKSVQYADGRWFEEIVDKFIGDSRQAPLLNEFRDELFRHQDKNKYSHHSEQDMSWESPPAKCQRCFDKGILICLHSSQPGIWAFRCSCSAGLADPRRQIPIYSHEYVFQYEIA